MSEIGAVVGSPTGSVVHLVMVDDDESLLDHYKHVVCYMLFEGWSNVLLSLLPGYDAATHYLSELPPGAKVFLVSDGNLKSPGKNGPDLLRDARALCKERGLVAELRLLTGYVPDYSFDQRISFLELDHRWQKGDMRDWGGLFVDGVQRLLDRDPIAAPDPAVERVPASPSFAPGMDG